MSDRKAVIKNADMSEEMQQDAVDCATQALEKYNIEKVSLKNPQRVGMGFLRIRNMSVQNLICIHTSMYLKGTEIKSQQN